MKKIYILDSNHFGIAGFYSMMAAKEGLMVALTITYFILDKFLRFLFPFRHKVILI